MNILALDTHSNYLSIGLLINHEIKATYSKIVNTGHSDLIIPTIQGIFGDMNLSEIDAIAYVSGPGSFTSLRIGLSVALGLSFKHSTRLIALPSFALYAKSINHRGPIMVALDAKLNEVYVAIIDGISYQYIFEPVILSSKDFVNLYNNLANGIDSSICTNNVVITVPYCDNIRVCGNAFDVYITTPNLALVSHIPNGYPEAIHMLELLQLNVYPSIDAMDAKITYIRDKVALNLVEQRHAHS